MQHNQIFLEISRFATDILTFINNLLHESKNRKPFDLTWTELDLYAHTDVTDNNLNLNPLNSHDTETNRQNYWEKNIDKMDLEITINHLTHSMHTCVQNRYILCAVWNWNEHKWHCIDPECGTTSQFNAKLNTFAHSIA